MRQHSFRSHTPEEMRRLSNLAHIIEGTLLAIVGSLALLGNLRTVLWTSVAWPVLILVAGILLLFLLYPLHPMSEWGSIWRDMQQREHTIIAAAVAVAGVAELLSSAIPVLRYTWPAAIILTGSLFFFHAQHGTSEAAAKALRRHRFLGSTLVLAGLLNLTAIVSGSRFMAILWPIMLFIASLQLLLYREPEGAYETGGEHSVHSGH